MSQAFPNLVFEAQSQGAKISRSPDSQTPPVLAPNELLDLSLILSAPASAVTAPNSEVTIRLCDTDTGRCDTEATRFLGPTP